MSAVEQKPFDDILTNFLEDLQGRCKNDGSPRFARSTALAYRGDARRFCSFLEGQGMLNLSGITDSHIAGYRQNMAAGKLSPRTISRKMIGTKVFLQWSAGEGLANSELANQVSWFQRGSVDLQPFLAIKEVEDIILASARRRQIPQDLAFRDPALIAVLSSGATITEALSLCTKDVTIYGDHVRISILGVRSGTVRNIKLDPVSSAFMTLHAESSFSNSSHPVFTSAKGARLSRQSCNLMMKETSERFNINPPITPTRLRYASVLRDRGNVLGIKKRLDVNPDLARRIAKHANTLEPSAFGSYLEIPDQDLNQGDYKVPITVLKEERNAVA